MPRFWRKAAILQAKAEGLLMSESGHPRHGACQAKNDGPSRLALLPGSQSSSIGRAVRSILARLSTIPNFRAS